MTEPECKRTASQVGKSNVARSKVHERLIAKWLSEWTGVEFRRRRVTGRDTSTRVLELCADVIPLSGEFRFSVEAKCGSGFSFDGLFANPRCCKFTSWWHQTCYDAQLMSGDLGRVVHPMVFFRPGANQNWVGFSQRAVPLLELTGPLQCVTYDGYCHLGRVDGDVSHTKTKKIVPVELDPVVFCRWKDFSEAVDPASAFERSA